MNEKNLKKCVYIVIFILVMIFFTKDIDFFDEYKNTMEIKNQNDILVLVNKKNHLKKDFIPINLKQLNIMYANESKFLREEAQISFEKLSSDALKLNYNIVAVSAYRDYNYQSELFNKYVLEKGENYALMVSAKPGHSEHQTGLAVDVMGSNNDYDKFENSKEFAWMKDNAHLYGFILRYPKGKEKITKFKYEPWHYRYVGTEVSLTIYKNNLTLEEYYIKYLK